LQHIHQLQMNQMIFLKVFYRIFQTYKAEIIINESN
jgi:hypothetical protein